MSISSALLSAVSGLNATSRAANVVSSNLANVLTDGYAPRRLEQEAQGQGLPGVKITGIFRDVDPGILADRRIADAELAHADTRAQFLTAVERSIGTPDESTSLSARLAAFDAALVSASATPENTALLQAAVLRAGDLTTGFEAASDKIQALRTDADGQIEQAVGRINTLLGNIQSLNARISNRGVPDQHMATLQDQRQSLIDDLSGFIPLRQVPRGGGTVALFTTGGAIVLDGAPATLDFTASNLVQPHMTLDNGLLSGLTINGVAVAPSGPGSPVDGGRLSALFSIRDDLAVDAQTQLDATARDVIERFQQAGLDPTLAPGDPGLFTDGGAAFDPLNEVGLSGRLSVNALVDPDQGGALYRLRDGLGASAPGSAGDGTLLSQLAGALSANRSLASGDLGAAARPASGHLANLSSRLAQDRLTLDQARTFASTLQAELADLEAQQGVDSDAETQKLLLIEQAFAANARVIQTVDEMMQTLLRI